MLKAGLSCLLLSGLLSCNSQNAELQSKLYDSLEQFESKNQKADSFYKLNLDSLTDFDWERCYIFHADSYFDNETISKNTGIEFKGSSLDDGSRRLVFVKGDKIVSYVDINLDDFNVYFAGGELQDNRHGNHQIQFYEASATLIAFKKCNSDSWFFSPENEFDAFREMVENNKCN